MWIFVAETQAIAIVTSFCVQQVNLDKGYCGELFGARESALGTEGGWVSENKRGILENNKNKICEENSIKL